ncbi:MAG: efflux RND transporter periplasmic adaptor subunit [Nitrospinota bacterium]|nr:efflux RND transporter periplasmic adaptor subunit [Nitrospinota bacterium]
MDFQITILSVETEKSISIRTIAGFALVMALSSIVSCSDADPGKSKTPAPALVSMEQAVIGDLPVRLTAVGAVEAYSTVSVKSQIGGRLQEAHFKEGQEVGKGDILFTIDPRPQQAALKQAQAILAHDVAQLDNARNALKRYSNLVKDKFVSAEKMDQLRSDVEAAQAVVQGAEAEVEKARLLLEYCYIHSPIDGVAGAYAINPGNIVNPGDDLAMTTIRQVQPVFVTFSIAERRLAALRKAMSLGPVEVKAFIEGDRDNPPTGRLVFIDNSVNQSTGTVKIKSEFDNSDKRLWPGQFVNVILQTGALQGVVTIPGRAVQMGQQGPYVFVVDQNNKAQNRLVEVSEEIDGLVAVTSGLAAGETIVTQGHIKVAHGEVVEALPSPDEKEPDR